MNCGKDDSGTCCGLCDFNPVVVIATHERVDITTKNINSLKLQHPTPKIVIVCSTQEELEYYKTLGVSVALEPNRPLGRKWQCGVNIARNLDANPLIIAGSDDILSKTFLRDSLRKILEGYELIGSTSWYTWDVKKDMYYYCRYQAANVDYPIGSGRVYSKELLKRINYKVFDTSADRKLDDQGNRIAVSNNAKIYLFREPEILAVKGRWVQMNSADDYLRSPNIKAQSVRKEDIINFNI